MWDEKYGEPDHVVSVDWGKDKARGAVLLRGLRLSATRGSLGKGHVTV
jgi:hypothetical protein